MIELVFAIVIIGILAAIALPKMAGTRDDAKVSVVASNIKVLTNEIASYILATKSVDDNFSTMSETVFSMLASGDATQVSDSLLHIKMNAADACVKVESSTSESGKIITLSDGETNDDNLCIALQELIDMNEYTVLLTGSTVSR